jgi:HTH-type transcriptional regulator / antitoxin HigA
MIYSDRQYQVSRTQLATLQAALAATVAGGSGDLSTIEADALRGQIADIEAEMSEYELLKAGQVTYSRTYSLSELPRVLVQARIARGLSQTDLAAQLNMKPQQVQRYEATNYMSASLARLIEVATALDVKISESYEAAGTATPGSIFAWNDLNDVSWSRLPYKEMAKRKWFKITPTEDPVSATRNFFTMMAGPQFATALHRKKVRSGNVPNEFALLAWQARVLGLASAFREKRKIGSFELNDTWVKELVQLTKRKRGPVHAREMLADRGIALIVERHLPGTYLDGAAMLSKSEQPVVALTLRYDRLDNFWFVLLHELGHIFLHLFNGLKFDFFDEEDGAKTDTIEAEADKFALDALIPSDQWDRCLSRFAMTEEAVRIDAQNLGIDASIIAGRIRKERNNYMVFNNLVGQNSVREQFEEADDATD